MFNAPPAQMCALLLVKQLAIKTGIRGLNELYDVTGGRNRIDQVFVNNGFLYRINGVIVSDAIPDLGQVQHIDWPTVSNQITELFSHI